MVNSYIIIDPSPAINKTAIDSFLPFKEFLCLGIVSDYDDALNAIIEKKPQIVFFHFSEQIPLTLLLELEQYLEEIPYVIAMNPEERNAFRAYKYGISDYLVTPVKDLELQKAFLRFTKKAKLKNSEKLCVKSNGDYHFLSFRDILYLQADSNTTDFHLQSGSMISGFKTMKFFESQLPSYFVRIHHSYMVNVNFVSRINLGKSSCYLMDNAVILPFSRTYRNSIETIIAKIG